ncbi:hypothetical protein BJF78_03745 [Pseudonocardia sp. CNS-139]|nr:hypothetical protein BJF78_03745 [Pseudonocardia sp. CNS-139]
MRRIVVVAGLVCMLVGALLDRRGLGPWDLGSGLDRLTAWTALVLAAAGLLSLAASRNVRVFAAVCASATAVPGALAVAGAVESGLPGPSSGVLAVGSAVVVLGVAARAFDRGPVRRAVRVGTAVLVVAAVGPAAVLAAAAVVDAPVTSAVAPAAEPAPLVTSATRVTWEWQGDGAVRDVRAAGPGASWPATTTWSASTGVRARSAGGSRGPAPGWSTSPSARTAGPSSSRTRHGSRVVVVTALDATTGERRWETPVDRTPALLVTDAVVAVAEVERAEAGDPAALPRTRLTARDLGSGDVGWRWAAPPGCGGIVLRSASAVGAVPVEGGTCPDGVTLRGLDERTGRQAWSVPLRPAGAVPSGYPLRSAAGGTLLVADGAPGYVLVDPARGEVVGRVDGTAGFPSPAPDTRPALVDGSPERAVAAVDSAGTVVSLPPGCPDEAAVTVTDGEPVRLCRTGRAFEVQTGTAAPVPLDLYPGDRFAALDPLRPEFLVPAPGALVVGVATAAAGLVGMA